MSRRLAGLRTQLAIAALAAASFSFAAGNAARADAIDTAASVRTFINYNTSGTIDSTGVVGSPVISFNSVASGAFTAPSSFSLGEFLVSGALAEGQTTTYNNTPFSITLGITKVDNDVPEPNETPITLGGFLNGSITGASQSDVVATFNPVPVSSFRTAGYADTLTVLDSSLSLVPSTTNGGRTTAQARIFATPVPEPTTVAVFLTALAGLGLYRRRLAAR